MDDPMEAMYVWLDDEGHQTLLLFALATVLGLASVFFFFLTDTSSPTRLQFVLMLAASGVLFYMSLRSSTY